MRHFWAGSWAAGFAIAGVVLTAPARAGAEADVQTTVAASAGWTDDATISGMGGDAPSSVVANVSPSIVAAWDQGDAIYRLGYTFGASVFLQSEGANAYTNAGTGELALTGSERSTWLFSLNLQHTQSNAQTLLAAPQAGTGELQLGGTGAFFTLTAGEGWSHELSPLWRSTQGLSYARTQPLDDDNALGDTDFLTFSLGAERDLRYGSFGVQGLGSLARSQLDTGMGLVATQRVASATLLGRWRREHAEAWTSELSAGAVLVTSLESGEGAVSPLGIYSLAWQGQTGAGGLTVSRQAAFNPLVGATLVTDLALVRGGVPLSQRVGLGGSVSVSRGRTVLEGADSDVVDTFSLDAELGYEVSGASVLGVRGQVAYQNADDARFADVARTSLLVTYTVRWPDETRTVMPVQGTHRMLRAPEIEAPGRGR